MSGNGRLVTKFEQAFAERVGAKYCIACANGTVSIQAALRAQGVGTGETIVTTPLTMSATTIAILNVGAEPMYRDVDPRTWLVDNAHVPVSLYGAHWDGAATAMVEDAAQTLRPHGNATFTSYSTQYSKIVSTGEGGMLATNNAELAANARRYLSLGYEMRADQSRIDSATLKSPDFARHHSLGVNGRMNDVTAALGLDRLAHADELLSVRDAAASMYRSVCARVDWIQLQMHSGSHDHWAYAVALHPAIKWDVFADMVVRYGGERPYGAWRLTYQEPAFRHLAVDGTCPIAEDLQPRIMQFQTNDLRSAARNAAALSNAITELGGP